VTIERLEAGDDGAWSRVRSEHHHRHHPIPAVVGLLRRAGLEVVGVRGNGGTGELDPDLDELRHLKAVLIARSGAHGDGGRR
jgi:hypothetical protein